MAVDNPKIRAGLKLWLFFFVLTIAAVALAARFVDRPVSLFSEALFGKYRLIDEFEKTPSFFYPFAALLLAYFAVRRIIGTPFARLDMAALLSGVSLLATAVVNGRLKYLFGKTWPKYGYPTFIHEGVYGFHPLHSGLGYDSFPSGHVAAVCALLAVFGSIFPRFKMLFIFTAVGFAAGLVMANFHFVSDVIAGGFVGTTVGLLCVTLWRYRQVHAGKIPDASPGTVTPHPKKISEHEGAAR